VTDALVARATTSSDAGRTPGVGAGGAVLRAAHDMLMTVERRPHRRWFADLKAEALEWWVRRASDQTLQSVIGSRLRGILLWQIFRTIRQRAQPGMGVNALVEFTITGRRDGGIDRYQFTLADGRCRRSRRARRRPALTLELEPVAFLRLVGGTTSPGRLVIAGKLRLHGDLRLALVLPAALRLPRRGPQMPVRKQ
jgi:SCP-2 sterol transfer family